MFRIAKQPVPIPESVKLSVSGTVISAQGQRGKAELTVHPAVRFAHQDGQLTFNVDTDDDWALAGTMRALAANLVCGVDSGFEKKLLLNGVGYRAQLKKSTLVLQLGYSHPVEYVLPDGIKAELPSQTEIIIKGIDKQQVGQVAADIRRYRPPEPYKGKGIKYEDEFILRKEGKKKA